MGAKREVFPGRHVVAGIASTVVISLTGLTVGVAPAVADPSSRGDNPSSPTHSDSSSSPTTTLLVPEPRAPKTQDPVEQTKPADEPSMSIQPFPYPIQQPTSIAPVPAITTAGPKPVTEEAPPVVTKPTVEEPQPAVTQTTQAPKPITTTTTVVPPSTTAEKTTPAVAAPSTSVTQTQTTQTSASPSPRAARPSPTSATGTPSETPSALPSEPAVAPTPAVAAETTTAATAPELSVAPGGTNTSAAPTSEAATTTTTAQSPTPSPLPSSSVARAARPIQTLKPETLDAPEADIQLAASAKPVEEKPEPAPKQDIAALSVSLNVTNHNDRDWDRPDFERRDDDRRDWDRKVRQWRPEWVQYDEYYRPMIFNPYREPVRVVYMYQNSPRIVTINPLQRVVMYAAELAAYSFTAVVVNAVNTAVNVAVGSFFGGGYIPAVGMPLPPPPPPVLRYDNVPVQVRYSQAVYEPFRVQRIVDVGDDVRYGERKVLLDGVTPAWGVWNQSASGERQFEVHRTQQFPGLDDPREAPLPGDYQMRLVSDETPAGLDRNQMILIGAAVTCALLSLGAVGLVALMNRRRGM